MTIALHGDQIRWGSAHKRRRSMH